MNQYNIRLNFIEYFSMPFHIDGNFW
jgi:hypothetical protein